MREMFGHELTIPVSKKHEVDNHLVVNPVQNGAVNGTRTRGPQLGKLMLYQLSYYRIMSLSSRPVRHEMS